MVTQMFPSVPRPSLRPVRDEDLPPADNPFFYGWREVLQQKTRALSDELMRHWDGLWVFVTVDGVEPTNNAAEQALRPAVLWRKGCFGTQSDAGSRFVERMLTVRETCCRQERHLLSFITETVQAHWSGKPAPRLIPTT